MGLYGVSFWLPQLIKGLGVSGLMQIGLLSAIPYGVAAICMVLLARSSDSSGERRMHLMLPALVGCAGLIAAGVLGSQPIMGMIALTVATAGILSVLPMMG